MTDKKETITFYSRGNNVAYLSTREAFECIKALPPTPAPTFMKGVRMCNKDLRNCEATGTTVARNPARNCQFDRCPMVLDSVVPDKDLYVPFFFALTNLPFLVKRVCV
jgi:hypothetical protein